MNLKYPVKITLALFLGLLVGAISSYLVLDTLAHQEGGHIHANEDSHDYGLGQEGYHVHADILVVINDKKIDLTADKYMSTAKRILHPQVHLHDNKDNIVHFHAPKVSLVEFMDSLSLVLTDSCFNFDNTPYCTNETSKLILYVNGIDKTNDLLFYEPQDNDQILLYYGVADEVIIYPWLEAVTDRACIYTGTCPERGTAPPEECGLTCEL